ncbi:MAG: lytic transglycosylase domain-containing protein [Flavobacteriales bacterium]|nr:lytic transglycosylase domain-containing protein [Flavobacteriales bacterium]
MEIKKRYRLTGIVLLAISVLVGFEIFIFSSNDHRNEDQTFQDKFNEDYRVYSIVMPEKLDFCGEKVPLINEDVYERMDRELLVNAYWQSNSLLYHKRANKWFPIIEPILKKNGVPDDFKYLALVESGLMNMVSPSGAVGFWQLLKATGEQYGLEVNEVVDERYSVVKSTEAACKYLKEAHGRYGNWTLAAASYNMGMSGVDRQLKRQEVGDYYDLLLNDETSRYVFRVLAAKEIHENPTKYGFHYRLKDLYRPQETYTLKVDTAIQDLVLFARAKKVNYKILKIFNPWLRDSFLTNKSGKGYEILLPRSGYSDFSSTEIEVVLDSLKPAQDTLQLQKGDE